ncbi:hypothetical protein [Marinoscillum sp.]|uniref:hypothetical protein n=1 Tax=Marinoscillum sp. TaxID=2024838 RepID=UPI003BA8D52E
MKKRNIFSNFLILFVFIFAACSEDDDLNPMFYGEYEGYYYKSTSAERALPVPLTLQFEKRNYTGLSEDSLSQSIFMGQFAIEKNQVRLTNGYNAVADSDWERILSGSYTFEIIDHTIHMSRDIDGGMEGFRLTKKGGL